MDLAKAAIATGEAMSNAAIVALVRKLKRLGLNDQQISSCQQEIVDVATTAHLRGVTMGAIAMDMDSEQVRKKVASLYQQSQQEAA